LLQSLLHHGLCNYEQFFFDIQMQNIFYFSRIKDFEKTRIIAKSLLTFCKTTGPLSNQIKLLLHMASIQLESDPMQCIAALTPLLRALAVADEVEMHGLHAVGMSILAKVFLRLQNPSRAIAILNGVLPSLTQKEHIRFQGEAYLTLAKAHLRMASTSSKEVMSEEKSPTPSCSLKQRYLKALMALDKSTNLFEESQDVVRLRECLFLQASVHSVLGNLKHREKISEKCLQLGSREIRPTSEEILILDAVNDPVELLKLVNRSIW
jgi:hypothetical protein